jgi:predicted enzyme related to lactoylglutathione lyase
MNLGYVILYVRDMNKAKAFYTDVLGMTVVDAASGPNFVTLRFASGSLIGLQDKAAALLPPRHETHAGTVELSFEVDDVDFTWQNWKDQGIEMLTEPMNLPFGRYFMAKDPDGHYLSVYRFVSAVAAVPAESASQSG